MLTDELDFQSIFEQMAVPYAILDHDYRYVAVNRFYTRLLSRSADQLVGNIIFDVFPETAERRRMVKAVFDQALAGQDAILSEVSYTIPDPMNGPDATIEIYWNIHCTPFHAPDGTVIAFGLHAENVTEMVNTRHVKEAIEHELRHRVSNLFAMISTIARRTAPTHDDLASFLPKFLARVQSLAETNSLLTGESWDGLTVQSLLERQLRGFVTDEKQVEIHGPEIMLSASDAQLLSMAVHELATNAAKYGAISTDQGHLTVDWNFTSDGGYFIDWQEDNLVNADARIRKGFGTTLLTRILPRQLNGTVEQNFSADSHQFRLTVSAPRDA